MQEPNARSESSIRTEARKPIFMSWSDAGEEMTEKSERTVESSSLQKARRVRTWSCPWGRVH